ncbi:hypothetical protein [Dapis sp. BLCC M229]|uniref:hypothetical protein n=1 Tax=Dapis sp. BLCC M229 TaxID=3400188 RepID=UPI003CEC3D23
MSDEEEKLKGKKLKGKKCDFFKDRYLQVKVSLNNEPGVSKYGTDKEPILVKLEQTKERTWYTENIVFLYENSHISFTLESEGPCGYGLKIFTMEKNIVNRLYAGNEGSEERITVPISRYQNDASSIRVKDFQYFLKDQYNQINNNILERSLVSIITWPIFGYDQGYYRYRPGSPPAYVNYKKSKNLKNKDLSKYVKNKDFKKYVKSIYSFQGRDFSRKTVDSRINDSNYIVKGPKSKESFNELITNVVEDNDKSDLKTNGSINMLFFILNEDEKVEDICDFSNGN